ncbi:MAG TPA: cobalamin biosynthesis protein, partial [Gammaproteobacteria bacterium]|nr:cobalamin biosynthesis protein [Gammaproteobacteria bacterium]
GEPARYHPLIGFGRLANRVERSLNKPTTRTSARLSGILAVGIVVLPVVLLTAELTQTPLLVVNMVVTIIVLFFCVGGHSLQAHTNAILAALRNEDLPGARVQLSKIVSRD